MNRGSWLPFWIPAALAAGVLVALIGLDRRPKPRRVGVAKIEVTPSRPVRLGGYGGRPGPHAGVAQRLWAKALALDGAGAGPAVWLSLETGGLSRDVWVRLRDRLHERTGIPVDRLVLTMTHTHSAPATTGWAPFIQPEEMSAAEGAEIDAYTAEVVAKLEIIALEALGRLEPANLWWTQGQATFAANRRTPGGPTDPALPLLVAQAPDGSLRALVTSYACHCTTCGGGLMQVCGDWAGYAQEAIERNHPGTQAMIAIGCAGDADPMPRVGDDQGLALARQHGESVAAEVRRLLAGPRRPLVGALETRRVPAWLPYAPALTPQELAERARDTGIVGRHARHWAAERARGVTPPTHFEYEVTGWRFGNDLTVLFLPGEVVVDYSLRLKRELDPSTLWINAYSQWLPCYIPSRRILAEGGYEAESSLWYYNRPGRLAPEVEDAVIKAAHRAAAAPAH